jgi:hypothetical protein
MLLYLGYWSFVHVKKKNCFISSLKRYFLGRGEIYVKMHVKKNKKIEEDRGMMKKKTVFSLTCLWYIWFMV